MQLKNTILYAPAFTLSMLMMQGCSHQVQTPTTLSEPAKLQVKNAKAFYTDRNVTSDVENNWLKTFNDAKLEELVQEALEKNPNLRVAFYNVEQAVAQTDLASAALKPTVGYNAGISNTNVGGTNSAGGIGASWQADVWGRVSAQVQSVRSSERSIEADYAFAKQSLVADVSKAWFLLIEAHKQFVLSQDIVNEYTATLDIVSVKFEVGTVLRKDVAQARADLNSAKDSLIQAKNSVSNSSRALELLLGRYPSAKLLSEAELPSLSKFPSTGVPVDLLSRRPDLIAKEEQIRSAFFATKEAELARLPSVSFSLGGGLRNVNSFIGLLSAGISGPIYTGGAIEAQIKSADAKQKKALSAYEATLLSAFKDIETYLANEKVLLERSEVLAYAVLDYETALEDTKTQYTLGEVELTLVQIQQRKLDASRSTHLHVQSLLLQNRVNMYLSLGGGFDDADAASEVKKAIVQDKKEEKSI